MKSTPAFRTRLLSHARIAVATALFLAGVAMVCIAAKTSSPPLLGKSDIKPDAKRDPAFARSRDFMKHFETLIGRDDGGEGGRLDGAAQEAYDNRAYPRIWIDSAQVRAAASAANELTQIWVKSASSEGFATQGNWQQLGPNGVHVSALIANFSTAGTAPTFYSGRTTAIAISPSCNGNGCQIF